MERGGTNILSDRTPSWSGHVVGLSQQFLSGTCTYLQWYAGDKRKIQLTCRHRQRYETEEELKMWNIGFDSDYDDDD